MRKNAFLAAWITFGVIAFAFILAVLFSLYTKQALEFVFGIVGGISVLLMVRGVFLYVKETLDNRSKNKENQ